MMQPGAASHSGGDWCAGASMRARRRVPRRAGLTSIHPFRGTTITEDVRGVALRPNVGVPSLIPLVGDRGQ